MSIKRTASLMLITPLTAILVVSTGCKLYRAEKAFDEGKYVESARAYSQVVQQNPNNVKARIGYKRSAALAADIYVLNALEAERKAETASANKNEAERDMQLEIAETEIRRALAFAPQNTVALDLLARVLARTEDIRLLNESMKSSSNDDLAAMRDRIENEPMIKLATKEPFIKTFRIPGRPLKDAFDMLSKHFGILFNYHTSFTQATDSPITLHVEDMPLERILDVLALQNELYYRYIDAKTVMVFKGGANATSRGENENQQYKNIYLDNSKPQEVVQTLQRLLGGQAQQRIIIAQDNRLNALIVKGRPSDIALVTWLARGIDKAKAEVMIYVELLEVTETSMEQVGLLPVADTMGTVAYRMGATIDLSGTFNINRGGVRISKEDIRYLFPSLQLDALKTSGEAKMAASQNMRISNDTGAIFNFGEKMFMQQSQALGTTGQQQTQYGYPPANNYQQQDVGIKVNITPRIHHNNEITLDIDADVTNLKPNSANIERPDLGQRKLKTEVRAQNGETIIFGGLRREDESKSKQGVWGISDIPILGKLLGSNTKNLTKTDVLLTVRAVIVRKPDLRPEDFRPYDPDFTLLQKEYEEEQRLERERRLLEARQREDAAAAKPSEAQAPPPIAAPGQNTPEQNAPEQNAPRSQNAPAPAAQPAGGQPAGQPAAAVAEAEAAPKVEIKPVESDMTLFLVPLTSQIAMGSKHMANLQVSGGKGVTNGELLFRVSPNLKLIAIKASDFTTREGGTITVEPEKDGIVKVKFQKKTATSDSGILLTIEVEAVGKGTAPVMIEGANCFMGETPLIIAPGQLQNALIEVE